MQSSESTGNQAPEQPTVAPEQPTVAPEQPTVAPEQPTVAPEQPTVAPEQPTVAPEQPTVAPEQPTVSTAEPASLDPNDVNAKTLAQLNTLMEESLQIYELEDQKTNVIDDLHNALQVITQFLGFSTNIHPEIFNLPSNSTISMLPNLKLIIKLANGKTETKKFTDYPPEVITQIVEYVTPQLLELIKTQKSYLTEKITFLRTATKQLSTLSQLKENLPSMTTIEEN